MRNIKGISIVSDGNSKRMAIIYDEIDGEGKVTNANARVNRVIVDKDNLEIVNKLEDLAQNVVDNLE